MGPRKKQGERLSGTGIDPKEFNDDMRAQYQPDAITLEQYDNLGLNKVDLLGEVTTTALSHAVTVSELPAFPSGTILT